MIATLAALSMLSISAAAHGRPIHDHSSQGQLAFKETTICETTAGVKGYSGYLHLPADVAAGRPFNSSTYFWFFESRTDPTNDPLVLWIQGGPGSPSIPAALGENGPCSVNTDSRTTTLNPWSWNQHANILFVDQPVQTGFSYNNLTKGTIDELGLPFVVTPSNNVTVDPAHSTTTLPGMFSVQDSKQTVSTSKGAARHMWSFLQAWKQQFPHQKCNGKELKLSLWSESYGGHFVPAFTEHFLQQNAAIRRGRLRRDSPINIDTVGIVNGCIDIQSQMQFYPQMAYNNTYGLQLMTSAEFANATKSIPQCKRLSSQCREKVATHDPLGFGNSTEANSACAEAYKFCFNYVHSAYKGHGRDVFDVAQTTPSDFPPKWSSGYLNSKAVQDALGVPLNFTGLSPAINQIYEATGDFVRGGNLEALSRLLDQGTKVALIYGDRDYQCNWLGGEQVSLDLKHRQAANFHAAGYQEIRNFDGTVGGMVRQYGLLSFARVFNAGHAVPYYQPELSFAIFNRTMASKDVATGLSVVGVHSHYSTQGASSVLDVKFPAPAPRNSTCYLYDIFETCTPEQAAIIRSGRAIMKDFVLVGEEPER